MAPNPLSSSAILRRMAEALPTHDAADPTSDLSSSLEAISLFTHACMASLDFRIVGFNEDQKMESEMQSVAPRLPRQWNSSVSSHSFVYAHTQSSMQFVMKIDRLGGKVEIRGLAVGHERICRVELVARDYVSSAALPLRITMTDGVKDCSDLVEKLKNMFISENRIQDLANLLKVNIIQRLLPSMQKEGYEDDPDARAAREDADAAGRSGARPPPQMPNPLPDVAELRPYPTLDPLVAPPRLPGPVPDFAPPDFEDEWELLPRRPTIPGGRPLGIGHDDLHPPGLGPRDPLRGSFVPGGGFGGMHPTFDDPLFRGGGQQGGGGFNPQAPPGARWDPVGPGGAPRFGDRRGGQGGGGHGGFGGGFSGDII